MVRNMQPVPAQRLQVPFYRTKLNSWMAAFEETYRFILLECDPAENKDWANLCIEQVCCPIEQVWLCIMGERAMHRAVFQVDRGCEVVATSPLKACLCVPGTQ
jgi:hypothetical protein